MSQITLSEETYARVEARVESSEFGSTDEYVEYVVTSVLDQIEDTGEGAAGDRDEVMDKLRDLGYLE